MNTRVSIRQADAHAVRFRRVGSRVSFLEGRPRLAGATGEKLPLDPFGAAVWLLSSDDYVNDIVEGVRHRLDLTAGDESVFQDVLHVARGLYQNGLLEVFDERGQVAVLAWQRSAVNQCHFSLTYRCNLRCKHCLVSRLRLKELSTDEVLRCIEQLRNLGCERISFSGGEVTLRRDFRDIIRAVSNSGIEYGFNTNATRLGTELTRLLEQYPPAHIGVSLYGDNPATHDGITRVAGSYSRTTTATKHLRQAGLPVTIKCMVLKQNIGQLAAIRSLAISLSCSIIFDCHIFPRRDGSRSPLDHAISAAQRDAFLCSSFARLSQRTTDWEQDRLVCRAGLDRCAIDPYGRIYPCGAFPLRIGESRAAPLREVLGKWAALVGAYIAKTSTLTECRSCALRKHCSPCPGVSYVEEGDAMLMSTWICAATHARQPVSSSVGAFSPSPPLPRPS